MSTESKKTDIREYQIRAGLTDTFGRLICNSRHHHFVVDGPAQNGCPGEALTPPEIFLAGVITCGVELVQVFARDKNLSLRSATGIISATLDRSNQARSDVTLFNSVRLDFTLTGVSHDEGHQLVDAFKARCRAACTAASPAPTPSSSFWRANSTIRIAFLAARPTRTTNPIWARMSIGIPRKSSPVTDARTS
jgi:uncharacterized OsmC-like protein